METTVYQNNNDYSGKHPIADEETTQSYINYLIYNFVKKPGQHLLELGRTGTGKTNFLFWLVDMFQEYAPREAIVWFDIGKAQYNTKTGESGNEILTLLYYFGAARIISLVGCSVEIDSRRGFDIEYIQVGNVREIWQHCKPDKINIVSLEPFLDNDVIHAKLMSDIIQSLVWLANRGWVHRPLAVFFDELNNVWPSAGHGIYDNRKAAGIQKRSNNQAKKAVQKLRSTGIRIVGSTHQWTEVYKSVRLSFEWLVVRRGTVFSHDVADLAGFNPRWKHIPTWAAYIVIPEGTHLGPFRCLYYKIPDHLGSVKYSGIYQMQIE